MQRYLDRRRIASVRVVNDLASDAALEPIGSMYVHGFNIVISKTSNQPRVRFTLAHEICHTFFYEFVPEMKFVPHETDPMEERLCDFGAAELLMPTALVRQTAAEHPICMQSLCGLAAEFSVSLIAMFLRLRSLHIWNCVFSEWHRMLNGTFVLANFYGGKRLPWEWEDQSILRRAWQSNEPLSGHTVVGYQSPDGGRYCSPAHFEVQRLGNRIFSLWGAEIQNPKPSYPLLDASARA